MKAKRKELQAASNKGQKLVKGYHIPIKSTIADLAYCTEVHTMILKKMAEAGK